MLIGLCGRIGSGKTSAALHLVDQHCFTRHRMADPIKRMLRCLGLDEVHTDGDFKEVPSPLLGGKTPRYAMQTLGTNWARDMICNDLWINAWRATLPDGDVVCDDIRFPNEADLVRSLGGIVVRVDRPGMDRVGQTLHASEHIRFESDLVIINNRGLEELRRAVERLITAALPMRKGFRIEAS
jgi:hypothetical protein